MGRMLTLVIALGVLGYMAYYVMYGRAADRGEPTPQRQLENVRVKAKDIEKNDQQYVNDIEKKTE